MGGSSGVMPMISLNDQLLYEGPSPRSRGGPPIKQFVRKRPRTRRTQRYVTSK